MEGGPRVLAPYPPDLSAKAEKLVKNLGGGNHARSLRHQHRRRTVSAIEHGENLRPRPRAHRLLGRRRHGHSVRPQGCRAPQRRNRSRRSLQSGILDLTLPDHPGNFCSSWRSRPRQRCGRAILYPASRRSPSRAAATPANSSKRVRRPEAFAIQIFRQRWMVAVIGRAAAVANRWHPCLSVSSLWFIRLFIHLIYIVEFQSRVIVLIQWGFLYLTFRPQRPPNHRRNLPYDPPHSQSRSKTFVGEGLAPSLLGCSSPVHPGTAGFACGTHDLVQKAAKAVLETWRIVGSTPPRIGRTGQRDLSSAGLADAENRGFNPVQRGRVNSCSLGAAPPS